MVPRETIRRFRVRSIGQQAGSGQMVTQEVCMSIQDGRMVVDWETSGRHRDSLRIEGWFAVLDEMSVPSMVGGDLLQGHDVMPRVANRQLVMQRKDMPAERVVTRRWTMAEVIRAIGEVQDEVHRLRCGTTWYAVWSLEVGRLRDSTSRGRRSYPQGP